MKRTDFASGKKQERPKAIVEQMEQQAEMYPNGTRLRITSQHREVITSTLHDIRIHRKEGNIYIARSIGFGGKEHALKLEDIQRLYVG